MLARDIFLLAGAAALVVVGGCSGTNASVSSDSEETPHPQSQISDTESESRSSEATQATYSSLGSLVEADALGQHAMAKHQHDRNTKVAQCMGDLGFTHLEEAIDYERQHSVGLRLQHASLYDPLLDFLPNSAHSAQDGYGVQIKREAIVRSNNEEYNEFYGICRQRNTSPESDMLLSRLREVVDLAYDEYAEALLSGDHFSSLVNEWSSCMGDAGFPVLDFDALESEQYAKAFGVELGAWKPEGLLDEPKQLKKGEVRIERPPDELEYVPSRVELDIALADAKCKSTSGLLDFVLEVHLESMVSFTDDYGREMSTLKKGLLNS